MRLWRSVEIHLEQIALHAFIVYLLSTIVYACMKRAFVRKQALWQMIMVAMLIGVPDIGGSTR